MLGSNVPMAGGPEVGFGFAREWGCDCVQVYLAPSRTWAVNIPEEEDLERFRTYRRESHVVEVISHIPFLVNLGSPDHEIREKSRDRLSLELELAQMHGVKNAVMHPGSSGSGNRREATENIVAGIRHAIDSANAPEVTLLLENMAGQGTTLGTRFDELASLLDAVERPDQLGVCLDTAHAFAAGYDLRGYEGYEQLWHELDHSVGRDVVCAVHVNDSMVPLGSGVDRHAPVGEGLIGIRAFHALMRDPGLESIPIIAEPPDLKIVGADCISILRRLAEHRAELPPDDPKLLKASECAQLRIDL